MDTTKDYRSYANNFDTGRDDKFIGSPMILPKSLPDAIAYRGYMDGYSGRAFAPPESPDLIINKLHEEGMVTEN
jgi:hypothetical protein